MTKNLIKALTLLIGLASVGAASAGIVYDNGSPDHVNVNAIPIYDGSSWGEDDFTFGVTTTVTDVHFSVYVNEGGYFDLLTNGVAFGIYPEAAVAAVPDYASPVISGFMPGALLTDEFSFDLGGGFAEFLIGFDLPSPVVLTGGVTYWLTLQSYSAQGGEIYWAAANGAAGNAFFHPNGDPTIFTPAEQEMAFQLTGPTVPSPGSLYLLAIAGLALFLANAQRRQRA
jgi:hypothetical protein